MQLAVSCCELYFARCCAVNWTGTLASESKVMCLSDFKKWFFGFFAFLNINQVECIKWINLINALFIGFVKQWFSGYQDQFCVGFFSRSTADCWRTFNKETALSFFFLLDYASRTCSMPWQYSFLYHSIAQSCKILLNSLLHDARHVMP